MPCLPPVAVVVGLLVQSGATVQSRAVTLPRATIVMRDDSSSRRAALAGFAQVTAIAVLASAGFDAGMQSLLEQATGARAEARQAMTLKQEAVADAKRLSKLARAEQDKAARLAEDAHEAADAAIEAERFAEAARLNRLYTADQVAEAKTIAEQLAVAAEEARAKGHAAVAERIRAEDSVVARQEELNAILPRLRLNQALASAAALYLTWSGLKAIMDWEWASELASDSEPATSRYVGGRRSAPDIMLSGIGCLADEPLGWFYGAPSPLYSSVLPEDAAAARMAPRDATPANRAPGDEPSAEPVGLADGQDCGEGLVNGFGGGEATRDPEPTAFDPNDLKGKQQAIQKVDSFAEYWAKRQMVATCAPSIEDASESPWAKGIVEPASQQVTFETSPKPAIKEPSSLQSSLHQVPIKSPKPAIKEPEMHVLLPQVPAMQVPLPQPAMQVPPPQESTVQVPLPQSTVPHLGFGPRQMGANAFEDELVGDRIVSTLGAPLGAGAPSDVAQMKAMPPSGDAQVAARFKLMSMSRAELQARAKLAGVYPNQKSREIIRELLEKDSTGFDRDLSRM